MTEVKIFATKDNIGEFKDSVLWKDIRRELKMWKRGFEMERSAIVEDAATENPSTASVLLHLGDINGRIKAVDYMLALPDMFLQILEDIEDGNRSDET